MKKIAFTLIIAFLGAAIFAQTLEKETTFKLDKKSAKGYLSVIRTDDDRQEISLVYNTKEKKKKTMFMNYVFDYDFNLISEEAGSEPKFKSKGGKKGKNRGDSYEYDEIKLETKGLYAGGTLTGTKIHVTAKWSWFFGRYMFKRKVLQKEKIKSSDDRKLFLRGSVTLENGDALALVAPKHKIKDIKDNAGIQHLVLIKSDFTVAKQVDFDLYYESGIVGYYVAENFMYAIYAPIKMLGGPKCKDGSEYTIVKIDIEKVEVVSKTKFNTKVGDWSIMDMQASKKGITFVGPGVIKSATKIKGWAVDPNLDKFDSFQIVHMNNEGKVTVALTTNDEINSKAVKFPTEKKMIKYNGKKYDFIGVKQIGDDGDIIVAMQDWKMSKASAGGFKTYEIKTYQEMVYLQFGIDGKLKGYYAIPSTAKDRGLFKDVLDIRQYKADFMVLESSNSNILDLLIFQPHHTERLVDYDTDYTFGTTTKTVTSTPMYYPRFIQIDFKAKKFTQTIDIGNQKYFLYDKEAVQTINTGSELLFIGESTNDRTLYMARFDLTK